MEKRNVNRAGGNALIDELSVQEHAGDAAHPQVEVEVAVVQHDVDGASGESDEEARHAVVLRERAMFATVVGQRVVAVDGGSHDVWVATSRLQ